MPLKGSEEIAQRLERRYAAVWADEVLSPGCAGWPFSVAVGRPTRAELEGAYARMRDQADELQAWACERELACASSSRLVGRVSYPFLSHVQALDVRALARSVGRLDHLECYQRRVDCLRDLFPACEEQTLRKVLVTLNRFQTDDVDFDLVCRAATWFAAHDASSMTAREVPLEGFHAKWLDACSRRQVICALTGMDGLSLRERPRLVRYRYLDPAYLATGARAHDSWVEGDVSQPAYAPSTVVICENRDSALWFPSLEGGIAVLGDGMAGTSTIVGISWVTGARSVFYWGDMDVHGFEILAKYRACGLKVRSILMDTHTFDEYERFGTMVDKHGKELASKPGALASPYLTPEENALYLSLCAAGHRGPRRIEQERIPLERALREVLGQLAVS